MTMASRRLWLAAVAALVVAAPAWAQFRGRSPQRPAAGQERTMPPRQELEVDRLTRPNPRAEGGRMSREERLQLRRDIGDAGRELYRREPKRRR